MDRGKSSSFKNGRLCVFEVSGSLSGPGAEGRPKGGRRFDPNWNWLQGRGDLLRIQAGAVGQEYLWSSSTRLAQNNGLYYWRSSSNAVTAFIDLTLDLTHIRGTQGKSSPTGLQDKA